MESGLILCCRLLDCWKWQTFSDMHTPCHHFTYAVASYSSSLNTRQLRGGGEPWGLRLLKECIVLHVILKWTPFGILWHFTDIAFVLANWFDFLRIYVYLDSLTLESKWLIPSKLYSIVHFSTFCLSFAKTIQVCSDKMF